MSEVQRQVNQLDLGNGHNHEVIMAIDHKLEGSIEGLERRLDGMLVQMREEMTQMREELGNQLQQFMLMFTHQNPVSKAPEFPPRDRTEPFLQNNRGHLRPVSLDMGRG